jgi:hypothetical protein
MAKGPDPSNVRAVGFITMELMQKYANDDGSVGVEDLTRWPANSKPVRFLSMTTSAVLVEELRQVRQQTVGMESLLLTWVA